MALQNILRLMRVLTGKNVALIYYGTGKKHNLLVRLF